MGRTISEADTRDSKLRIIDIVCGAFTKFKYCLCVFSMIKTRRDDAISSSNKLVKMTLHHIAVIPNCSLSQYNNFYVIK